MASVPEQPPEAAKRQGISFHALSEAFARVTGRRKKDSPLTPEGLPSTNTEESAREGASESLPPLQNLESEEESAAFDLAEDNDPCQLCPRSILEAMLFVGNQQNEPLTSARAAELMRGVAPEEIPDLIDELNRRYTAAGTPYQIVGEGAGYRLVLRRSFHGIRDRFYGRVREVRLSQAAVDVLAIVAYRQPITAEDLNRVRGRPSNGVLSQLVRRQLLRIDRPPTRRKAPQYYTTDRFLELFGLESLDDLPQAEDIDTR